MLDYNQRKLTKWFIFRPSIYWDSQKCKFSLECNKFRHFYLRTISDFLLVFCINMCSCLWVFWDAIHNPAKYEWITLTFVTILFFSYVMSLCTSMLYATKRSETVGGCNQLIQFLHKFLEQNHKTHTANSNNIIGGTTSPNGSFIVTWIIPQFCKRISELAFILSIFVIAFCYIMEVDSVFLSLRYLLAQDDNCIRKSNMVTVIRLLTLFVNYNDMACKCSLTIVSCILFCTMLCTSLDGLSRSATKVRHWCIITIPHCALDVAWGTYILICLSSGFYILILMTMMVVLMKKYVTILLYVAWVSIYAFGMLIGNIILYVLALPAVKSAALLQQMYRDCSSSKTLNQL